ncbi:hypothetical protein CFIMG_005829RAa [Ceratocystis fimbriata CBS 114723]|uniref:Uncharacterized protein n=1 Tax=Ceratocystis fimbriata CBS 114723 TaxID=1035309 RepID=A0A2C5WZZ0_9PEZI|nr:hypothetical protein CFIMG_005829RAa [Ceratocystis fimbriata CBS 114723]
MALYPGKIYHVGLRPHCGICSHPMEVLDRCVLLLGNDDSTGFSERLGPFIFPDYGYRMPDRSGVLRCRKPDCCTMRNPEASTVHYDCFEFISQRFDLDSSMDYLWIATAWQTPWRQAPHFRLEETTIKPDWSLFDEIGLPQMKMLPLEIVQMIYNYSPASLFWRFHSASFLGQQLSTTVSDYMLSIPLNTVLTWERGSRPKTTNIPNELPVFLLTIDAWGIQEIKRLSGNPPLKRWRADDRVFVIADRWKLAGVAARFKFGYLRLELPRIYSGLQTWDTPTPPLISQCQVYPSNIRSSTQFKTIDLRQTNGLTFFYSSGAIFAIHAHTEKAPYAQKTFQRLNPRRRDLATWVYVPFSQNDSIDALGVPMPHDDGFSSLNSCLLFRMRLAGDVTIGLTYSTYPRRLLLGQSPPTTMIYNTVELGAVSVLGAYSIETDNQYLVTEFDSSIVANPPSRHAFFSLAPLENVNRASIFSKKENGACMGILLQYQNGARRSLGQCRLGIDHVQHYANPMFICLSPRVYIQPRSVLLLHATLVNFMYTQEHEHSEQGWTCCEMKGELEFWFSAEETKLRVTMERH